jgi:GrpB-like predicted nucleotidyltransferase (UPF0157 family)
MIEPYEFIRYDDPADAFRPYDPRFPAVAARVVALIAAELPGVTVEHIGSTAVPGCAGKGVIDFMLLTTPAELARVRAAVEALGFRRYDAPNAHPESRPVMLGSILHEGERFRLHLHLIAPESEEVERQRRFRDRLRADPALVAEYVAAKRATLERGVTGADAYNDGKDAVIARILADGG